MNGYRLNSHKGDTPELTNDLLNEQQLKQPWNNTLFD